jgi:hypothetical protein
LEFRVLRHVSSGWGCRGRRFSGAFGIRIVESMQIGLPTVSKSFSARAIHSNIRSSRGVNSTLLATGLTFHIFTVVCAPDANPQFITCWAEMYMTYHCCH